jgi:putative component of membrane protein insertase Oxa1/YidC/SpoIIIJ protein YidD
MVRNRSSHIWHSPATSLVSDVASKMIALFITGYQHTLSPDHGPLKTLNPYGYCRHEPTCSVYGKQIILEKGVIIGGAKTLWRVLSCHPWKKLSDEKIRAILDTKQG